VTLLVCSKSTLHYLPQYDNILLIASPPQKSILTLKDSEEDVVAIGGGAVIDAAKIISKTPIVCYPTTAAGSSATAWSVYWDGTTKCSIHRQIPRETIFEPSFIKSIPDEIRINTICDVISHCLDSLNSIKANSQSISNCEISLNFLKNEDNLSLLKAGHYAGKAIQITGTNLLHSLSYPITAKYGISHGRALACLLPKVFHLMSTVLSQDMLNIIKPLISNLPCKLEDYKIDIEYAVDEAYKYSKMSECNISFNSNMLKGILNG
tara:strand:- start:2378 stop:3172 length:795 start_codon:yes stop_codon:yes gene_type:complete